MLTMYLFYELLTLATLPLVMQPMTAAAKAAGIKYLLYSMSGAALAFIGLVFLIRTMRQSRPRRASDSGDGGDLSMLRRCSCSRSWASASRRRSGHCTRGCRGGHRAHPRHGAAARGGRREGGRLRLHRLVYYSCGTELLRGTWAQAVCIVLALVTILYGSCMSLKQRHFKRRLAYSTISNLSYILFAAVLMTAMPSPRLSCTSSRTPS